MRRTILEQGSKVKGANNCGLETDYYNYKHIRMEVADQVVKFEEFE